MKRMIMLAATAAVAYGVKAAELVVDKAGGEGVYESIQAAVGAAKSGDTILVHPGTYDNGYSTYVWTDDAGVSHTATNRVSVNKKLYIKSTGGAANTTIKGVWDMFSATKHSGCGDAAIRCAYVGTSGAGTVFEGFTFEDGAAHASYKTDGKTPIDDIAANRAGGLTGDGRAYAVDCVFHHCTGGRSGAIYNTTAVRCRFKNSSQSIGMTVSRSCAMLHCLVEDNASPVMSYTTLVNCTLVNNAIDNPDGGMVQNDCKMYNTVIADNLGLQHTTEWAYSTPCKAYRSCVSDGYSKPITEGTYIQVVYPDEHSVTNVGPYQFMAPLLGDFRIRSGTTAAGVRGDAAFIAAQINVSSAAASIDLYHDFAGNAVAASGELDIGCIQGLATSKGGAVKFDRRVIPDGSDYRIEQTDEKSEKLYAFFDTWPKVFHVNPGYAVGDTRRVMYWTIDNSAFPPEMDDSYWFVTPPEGRVIVGSLGYTSVIRFVDASSTAEEPDGSKEKPWKTIQAAFDGFDAKGDAGDFPCVVVAEGTYSTGGYVDNKEATLSTDFGNSRFKVNRACRVVGAGRGKTIVLGAAAKSELDEEHFGHTNYAYRCALFTMDAYAIVQGMTLRDGYARTDNPGDWRTCSGGCVLGIYKAKHIIADCELDNGNAFRGCAFKDSTVVRCNIHNMYPRAGALVRPGAMDSSLIYGITTSGSSYIFGADNVSVWNSTVTRQVKGDISSNAGNTEQVNNIYQSSDSASLCTASTKLDNTLFCKVTPSGMSDYGTNYKGEPYLADIANGDARLLAFTDAIDTDKMTGAYVEGYWLHSQTDYLGNPRIYFANGRSLPGAVQKVVSAVNIAEVTGVTTTPAAGLHAVEPGETITVTMTPTDPNRAIIKYNLNGEIVDAKTVNQWTYTAPTTGFGDAFSLTPILLTDWYVSPTGSNGNNGWTKDAPFQTLEYAMGKTASGDTVHALPGTYREGSMKYSTSSTTGSRVHVGAGVTLISEEGPEKTIIEGKDPDTVKEEYNGFKFGEGALRCVSIKGGRVEGFTLTGGRTDYASSNDSEPYSGGGVFGNDYSTATVVDCIISNNAACRGGGMRAVTAIGCRIINNCARATSTAGYNSAFYGCLLKGGKGLEFARFCKALENCTIDEPNAGFIHDPNYTVARNTIVHYSSGTFNFYGVQVTNCVLITGKIQAKDAKGNDSIVDLGNIWVDSKADIKLDADSKPAKDSPAVDMADHAIVSATLGVKDASGGQRIYNGKMDIGAFEYDWRGDYTTDLGGVATVSAASSNVVQTVEKAVLIPSGEITLTLPEEKLAGKDFRRSSLSFEITGTGTLNVLTNGAFCTAYEGTTTATTVNLGRLESTDITLQYVKPAEESESLGAMITRFTSVAPGMYLLLD